MKAIDKIVRQYIVAMFYLSDLLCKAELENSRKWGE